MHAPIFITSIPPVDSDGCPEVKKQKAHRVILAPYITYDEDIFAEDIHCPMPYRETYRTFKSSLIGTAFIGPSGLVATVSRTLCSHDNS